jgi:hypothetical protein
MSDDDKRTEEANDIKEHYERFFPVVKVRSATVAM